MNLPVSHMLHDGDGFSLSNLKDLFKVLPFKSIVFRPNYFTMLFVKDAHADYTTDNITFAMEPGKPIMKCFFCRKKENPT